MKPNAPNRIATLPWGLQRLRASLAVPDACRAECDLVIQLRIRGLASVLAVLTASWIVLDHAALPADDVPAIALVRLGMALALLGLARLSGRMGAKAALRAFVWLQALGFGAIQLLLVHDRSASLGIGYGLFPFLVAAQLAVFPVTWAHTLRCAVAPVLLLVVTHVVDGGGFDIATRNDVWLLALLVFVAAWTAQSQLNLLVGLLGARREASHDPLTGLANRRQLDARLDAERARCLRHGEPLSVLMCDLDHFKRVNDLFGHAAGDVVLAAAADALAGELRASDVGARYGGEEFVALLPETTPEQALAAAERVRRRIAALHIDVGDAVLTVTVSIGIASLEDGESGEALLARADAAMYRAKESGRNRCVFATPAEETTTPAA